MSQSTDMDAIIDYFNHAASNTSQARDLKSSFLNWAGNLSWFDKNFNSSVYDEARSRRNAYNLANATTPEAKQQVQSVIDTGMTTEQMQADPSVSTPKKKTMDTPTKVVSHPTIRLGSKGDDVKEWQQILNLSPVDGDFGPATKAATKVFQSGHGLKADGVVGPKTWMAAYVSSTIQSGSPVPGAVIDPGREMPPAIAPKSEVILQKAQTTTTPMVAQRPIGIPVPASKVPAFMSSTAAMITPSTWTPAQKGVAGFFAAVAIFFGFKKMRER